MKTPPLSTQTGFGFDSHTFGIKGPLKLGGISISDCPRLLGHSDGDALIHALIDALLGAAVLGDIGEYFSDSSRKNKGLSSVVMLKSIVKKIQALGYQCGHVDVTVVADRPKMRSYKKKIKMALGRVLNLSVDQINIKAKTLEGLMWFAAPGGLAVWVVATLNHQKKRI